MHPILPIPGFSEPVSSISHLAGAGIFALLMPWLLYHGRGSAARLVWLCVFCASVLFLLPMSGVYHLLSPGSFAREEVLRRLDHAAIFVLIAGSFTAAHGILFTGFWRWGMIALLWAGVATAIPLKTVFFHSIPEALGLGLYLGFGWLGLVSGVLLYRRYGLRFILPLLAGGLAYSAGAVAEFLHAPVLWPGVFGPHEFFHVMVLAGLACHWRFIWDIAGLARRGELQEMVRSAGETGAGRLGEADIERLIREGVGVAEIFDFRVEHAAPDTVTVRLPHRSQHLRPGGTVSGPAMMMLADTAMYALILCARGPELQAVTTSMTLNFLSRPAAGDLLAQGRVLKAGRRLVVMEVSIHSAADDGLVAHVTGTYALPVTPGA